MDERPAQNFKTFDDLHQVALKEGCPKEFEDREDNWTWLCSHFQEPDYVVRFFILSLKVG